MDIDIIEKQKVLQPQGALWMFKNDCFEVKPIFSTTTEDTEGDPVESNELVGIETIDDEQAILLQEATFASLKQRGSDSLDPYTGVQWAEHALGTVSSDVIMFQIQEAVSKVSASCQVTFVPLVGADGVPYFTYTIQVVL